VILGGRLWRHPDFLKMWAGQTVSQFGSQVTLLALPTVVVLTLHGSALQVGLLATLQFLPFPTLGLAAGVWLDRLRRRPVMIVADVGRALALGSIPVAFLLHSLTLTHLYVVAVVTGVCTVFFEIGYQSYLPSLIERTDLVEGNTKLELTRSAAQVAGPLTAGLLIQALGAARVVAVDAASFVVSVLSLAAIRAPERRPAAPTRGASFVGELAEGLRVVLGNRVLNSLAGCTAMWNLGSNVVLAVLLIFAYRDLRLSPAEVGFVFGAISLGGVAGALVAGRLARRLGLGRTLLASILVAGLTYLGMPLAQLGAPLVVLSAFGLVQGMQVPIYNINQVSLRQAIVPDRLQGRMNATMRTIVWGALPVGSLLGGVLGSAVGVVPTLLVGGALSALAAAWIVTGPVIRLTEQPAVPAPEPAA
jgi:MFS family permease